MTRILALLASLFVLVPAASAAAAEVHITSGLAAILNATTPLFTVLVADRFLPW